MKNTNSVAEFMEYTPMYKQFFLQECKAFEKVLKSNLIDLYHIGSTAIPKISAIPTIDLICVVHTLDGIALFKNEFNKLGLNLCEINENENELIFQRISKDDKTFLSSIRVFEKCDERIEEILLFRDRLNQDEELAKKYEKEKMLIREKFINDPKKYQLEKEKFIKILSSGFSSALKL